jgi:hypothetical protein
MSVAVSLSPGNMETSLSVPYGGQRPQDRMYVVQGLARVLWGSLRFCPLRFCPSPTSTLTLSLNLETYPTPYPYAYPTLPYP